MSYMTNYYWYYKEEKCWRGAAILWFIMFPAFFLLCMHPTASSCCRGVTDACFTQAVISVFARSSERCISVFTALFQRSRNCIVMCFALLHTACMFTKKKTLSKTRDCLVTLMQIKGAKFFYINYTGIQGWEVSMATLLSYGMHKAPSILWNYYLPFKNTEGQGKRHINICTSVNTNTYLRPQTARTNLRSLLVGFF